MTRLEREIQSLKEKSSSREKELIEQHTSQVQQLNKVHSESLETTKQKAEAHLTQTKEVRGDGHHQQTLRHPVNEMGVLWLKTDLFVVGIVEEVSWRCGEIEQRPIHLTGRVWENQARISQQTFCSWDRGTELVLSKIGKFTVDYYEF